MSIPRCVDCPQGGCASGRCFAAYAPDQAAMSAALDKIRDPVVLSVVTMDIPLEPSCDGGYLCSCRKCMAEKVAPIKQVRQPWQTRRAA
jgi:hypothetical protein